MGKERSRTYHWDNPLEGAKKGMSLSGFDYMKAIFNGEIAPPPIIATAGIKMSSLEKRNVIFEIEPKEFQYNPIGSVHGGIITTILDSAIGCSLHSILPEKSVYTTLEIKVNFVRKITESTGVLKTTTKIIHSGKSTALIESSLIDDESKVYAHAISTCMIFQFP